MAEARSAAAVKENFPGGSKSPTMFVADRPPPGGAGMQNAPKPAALEREQASRFLHDLLRLMHREAMGRICS